MSRATLSLARLVRVLANGDERNALTGDLPDLNQQRFVRPCFDDISTDEMRKALTHLTSFYNRYYHSTTGERSARWLHDHIAEVSVTVQVGALGREEVSGRPDREYDVRRAPMRSQYNTADIYDHSVFNPVLYGSLLLPPSGSSSANQHSFYASTPPDINS